MNPTPLFLSIDDVLILHAIAIEDQGGDPSIRDLGRLESSIAMPAQQFGGQFLHEDIPSMAAAYAFHICLNHPFTDGNKRAATAAMIAFLSDNGWSFDAAADEAEPLVLELAAGILDKPAFTNRAREYMHGKPKLELRSFFSRIDSIQFNNRFLSLLPGETQVDPQEFFRRVAEVMPAMPFVGDLARQQQEAHHAGDDRGWDRLTMLAVGMLTLHAIAEDMGYEW